MTRPWPDLACGSRELPALRVPHACLRDAPEHACRRGGGIPVVDPIPIPPREGVWTETKPEAA